MPRLIPDRTVRTTTSPGPGAGSPTGRISPQPGSRSQNAWATCWRASLMTVCVEVRGTSSDGFCAFRRLWAFACYGACLATCRQVAPLWQFSSPKSRLCKLSTRSGDSAEYVFVSSYGSESSS